MKLPFKYICIQYIQLEKMTTTDKIEYLKNFQNEKEFREFLIDFLKKVGFNDVMHTHRYGNPELGKDIIGRFTHGIEGEDWYAFVVKKGRIGGGTDEVENIKNQIKQSFEYPYKGIDGSKLKINKVKVVTNENFTQGAQTSISDSPELKVYNNFSFWWNENLIPLIDKHYPDFWLPGDAFSKEYSKGFTKKLQEEIEIRELSIRNIDDKKIQKLLDIFIEPKLTTSIVEENKLTKEKSVKDKKINIKSISKIDENILLSGEQGAGKTKVLNTIACNLSSAEIISETKTIPVKIKAPSIRDIGYNIESLVDEEIKKYGDQFYTSTILEEYKPLLFIDDLDLLSSTDKEKTIDCIKDFCTKFSTNYVLTYRKSEFDFDNSVKKINIHNFNPKQVESFVTKFFEGTDRGAKFIRVLKESDIFSKLPTTPLTISLISLLYDENNFEIPATLSDIYSDFTAVLLGKLNVKNKHELLVLNLKKRLFSSLALNMMDSKKFEISFDDYCLFINDFLSRRGYQSQSESEIDDIIEHSGLLYKDFSGNVGFKQQAFIEFFASFEIYHHKRKTHYEKIIKGFNDVNWQNTAIFYAGHSKELDDMIDDVIREAPNNNIRDWFINTGGMGYLSQALYQTAPEERKKLVFKSLDNLLMAFEQLKLDSKDSKSAFHNVPLPFAAAMVNFWFNENFKSVTLIKTLSSSFEELLEKENSFENNYKMLMLATTLMNPYIGIDSCFEQLIERHGFMSHPILPLVADIILEMGYIDKKTVDKEKKDLIKKAIFKKRDYIKAVLKEPAYRFNDNFGLIED